MVIGLINRSKSHAKCSTIICSLLVALQIVPSSQHGRVIDPVSRATMWRFGYGTPENYNDHEMFCGGFTHQFQVNGGKCGECGDPWDLPKPRPYEFGGKMHSGIIVRKYETGSQIVIHIDLVSYHFGYFEFKLCDSTDDRQECFNKYPLEIISATPSNIRKTDSKFKFYPRSKTALYKIKLQLPANVECAHCVLQWRYRAATNWGICEDGVGLVGCGPQEEFRACSDISIGKGNTTSVKIGKPTRLKPDLDPFSANEIRLKDLGNGIDNAIEAVGEEADHYSNVYSHKSHDDDIPKVEKSKNTFGIFNKKARVSRKRPTDETTSTTSEPEEESTSTTSSTSKRPRPKKIGKRVLV